MSEPRIRAVRVSVVGKEFRVFGPSHPVWASDSDLAAVIREACAASPKRRPALPPQRFPKPDPADRERKHHEKHGRKARKTMAVYDAVATRAAGMCECGCDRALGDVLSFYAAPEMDHFWGRARAESVETCWMLRAECHRDKTNNRPDRREWLGRFAQHCLRYEYRTERRRALDRKDSLDDIEAAAEVSRVR